MTSMNHAAPWPKACFERGRTLIELLVAIGLGLLILLGVGTLFMGSNQSSRVAVNVASAEETGQVILSTIGAAVRRAGYAEIVGVSEKPSRADLLYSGPLIQGCVGANFALDGAGEPVLDGNGYFTCGATVAGAPDSLAVVFQADSVNSSPQGATADCLGQAAPLVQIVDPNYRDRVPGTGPGTAGNIPLVRNIYALNGTNLTCRGNGSPLVPMTLIGEVEDFKVYFGFDDDAQATPLIDTGRPAARTLRNATHIRGLTAVGPNFPQWDFVVTVHVCVLIRSVDAGVTAQTGTPQHTACPQTADEAAGTAAIVQRSPGDGLLPAVAADGRVRRAYSQVFTVRSRAAPAPAV